MSTLWHLQLIGQRRRWLNGSLAAGIYSLWHFGRVYLSGHGMIRLAMLHVQALLNFVTMFMGFFALANLSVGLSSRRCTTGATLTWVCTQLQHIL